MEKGTKRPRLPRNGYRIIAQELQRRVEGGEITPGSYFPTERELQAEFGASRTAIRRALEEVVQLGWGEMVPNKGVLAARGIRPGRTPQVAFVDSGSYVCRMLATRMSDLLRPLGLHLVHLGGRIEDPLEDALVHAFENDFAGAIVWPYRGFPDSSVIERVARRMPIIALDHRLGQADTDLVTFNQLEAGFMATEHLIQQGCRRIGVTGMIDMLETSHQRFSGYLKAMFAHGLQPRPRDFIFTATSGHDEPDPYPMEQFLRSGDRPDALLVLQDMYVPSTVEAALRSGLSVPHDLKLAAIGDDVEVEVDGFGLTSVACDWNQLAGMAIELLDERMSNPSLPSQVRLAGQRLVVRGLCGAPPESWTIHLPEVQALVDSRPFPRSKYRFSSRWGVN